MPLPASNSIPLMVHSRPGERIKTNPKITMMVRMTEDSLDVLQSLAPEQHVEFEFGDRSVSTVGTFNCGSTIHNPLR